MSLNVFECFHLWGEGGLRTVSQMFPFILDIELCAQSLTEFGKGYVYAISCNFGRTPRQRRLFFTRRHWILKEYVL